jgi:hypothetical protein
MRGNYNHLKAQVRACCELRLSVQCMFSKGILDAESMSKQGKNKGTNLLDPNNSVVTVMLKLK